MKRRVAEVGQVQRELTRFLARYSVPFLRVSLGLVFLGFGLLKFAPGVSPAEDISARTVDALSLGIVEGRVATVLVALMETAIGLCLVTGRRIKLGLGLLGMAMVGVLSPLVLFPGELFDGKYNAPTIDRAVRLEGHRAAGRDAGGARLGDESERPHGWPAGRRNGDGDRSP